MKLNKILLTLTAAGLMLTGCSKFGDTNVSPNGTETPSTGALLTNVLSGLGGFSSQTRGGLYAQQFSETQYTETSLYSLPKLDFDGIYAGSLYDLQNIIKVNTDEATKASATKFGSNANQIAVARIVKAYQFWTITDRWGNVPYFDALKGSESLTPAYDKQEDIYKDLIKELTEAVAQFDAGAGPTGDIVYAGDITKWKKLANSLRMLIALRTSKVYPAPGGWAATEFAAAFNDANGYINSNADNVVLSYPGGAFKNPWFALYDGRNDFAESDVMVQLLAGDPRQAVFGSSNVGFPYGLTRDDAVDFGNANSNYAKVLAPALRAANSKLVVIAAAQVALAIAEAAQRGWITADALTWYQKGITLSWEQWGVTGNIATYSAVDLAKINLQQYFAYYQDGIQAWSNWRRTNIPALTVPADASNSGRGIPRRYVYGANEYSLNKANVATNAALYNNDSEAAKVWWDQ
ncbi:MAG: SusD/RagB family nutrient-binding outer membrane lipoprotein [Chitinophagaceae bacterium]